MKEKPKAIGKRGEMLASEYLAGQGVEIIGRNIRTAYGEIDLIGQEGERILFVEVKTLKSRKFGHPEVSVNAKKKDHMIQSALAYLQENNLLEWEWRIDVVSIEMCSDGKPEIQWFRNAIHE